MIRLIINIIAGIAGDKDVVLQNMQKHTSYSRKTQTGMPARIKGRRRLFSYEGETYLLSPAVVRK